MNSRHPFISIETVRVERFSLHMVILINATHIFVNYKVNSKLAFIISQTNYIYHITLQSLINLHKNIISSIITLFKLHIVYDDINITPGIRFILEAMLL